jgi:hypothetical protein
MSSVAGGVINLRAARGADPRTALVDWDTTLVWQPNLPMHTMHQSSQLEEVQREPTSLAVSLYQPKFLS